MSSDLWNEFGGGQEVAVNPWAETLVDSSTTQDEFEDEFGDFQEPVPVTVFETPQKEPTQPSGIEVEAKGPSSPFDSVISQKRKVQEHAKRADMLSVPNTPSPFQTPNNPSMARAFGQGDNASPKSARIRPIPARETSSENAGLVEQIEDDDWADFSTANHTPSQSAKTKANAPNTHNSRSSFSENIQPELNSPSKSREGQTFKRPKYIPPPSVLIAQFITLIQELPNRVEAAMQYWKVNGGETKDLELALRKCIAALRVGARIIAGRKSRWIRDTGLAQSMKMGQAQGAKLGGMKLTGVDKVEAQRENSQTAEFVRVWKQRLGAIRVALAHVKIHASDKPLVLPEISETMLVGSSKNSMPVMNDRTNCCLCGLKREERVLKVDVDVWDTSGEWWSSLWGHTDCRTFWEEHGNFLLQG